MQCLIGYQMTKDPNEKVQILKKAKGILLKSLTSSFNWQICGHLQKYERNYLEAAKCFQQALKFNPNSIQIIRDTSNLFLHSRDLANHKNMRKLFVQTQSDVYNYCGYALACHIALDYEEALQILDMILDIAKKQSSRISKKDLYSVAIYKALILKEAK